MVSMASYSMYNNNVLRYGLIPLKGRRVVSSCQQWAAAVPRDETSVFSSSTQGRLTGGGHQLVHQHPGWPCHLLGHRFHGSHAQPPSGQHSHGRWAANADGLLILILPPLAYPSVCTVSGTMIPRLWFRSWLGVCGVPWRPLHHARLPAVVLSLLLHAALPGLRQRGKPLGQAVWRGRG